VYVGAGLLALWTFVPIYWLLAMSFMYNSEVVTIPADLYPHQPTFANYLRLFDLPAYGLSGQRLATIGQAAIVRQGWVNSLIVAVSVTALTMLLAVPLAYALGRLKFRLRSTLLFSVVTTRAYPPIAVLIPFSFLFSVVGLEGTRLALIIIYLTITIPLVSWVLTGFFAGVPLSVEKLARVDGLTRWQTFYRVMVPVAGPGIAACAVIAFIAAWNEFTFSLILTAGSSSQTFPPTLSGMFFQVADPAAMAAASILGFLPPALVALAFQKWIRQVNIVDPL